MRQDSRSVIPLIGAALVSGCLPTTSTPSEPLPDPPTAEQLAACEGQDLGAEDFDWSCCEVWAKQCLSEGKGEECDWICNG